jgi:hypothetical protein
MPIFTGNNDGWSKMEAAKDTGWIREVERRMKKYGISHASFNVETPKARVRKPRAKAAR